MARGFYWSANSPFIQKHWVRVRRAPRAPALGDVESGFINQTVGSRVFRNANPAYLVYECLTNTVWGMGTPVAQVNNGSFQACAQLWRTEAFGLFMLWTNSDTIENFVAEVLDHVQAVLYLSPVTGQWTLKALRADYTISDLPSYTVDDATFTDFNRKQPGETVNEIIVKWTNPVTEKEETVGAQDLANIVAQGGQVVSQDRNYYGVRSGELATRLAARDLRTAVAPLATCNMRVSRRAWAEAPGNCLRITVPDEDAYDLVMRVQDVDYGNRTDAYIKVALIEDIFALDAPAFTGTAQSGQSSLALEPNPPIYVKLFTLPAFILANANDVVLAAPEEPEVVAGILINDENRDFFNVETYTATTLPNGSVVQQSIGTRDPIGVLGTEAPLVPEAFTVLPSVANMVGARPRLAGFAFIGLGGDVATEVALVQAIDANGSYTLARGVLDTVPRAWPVGTPIWFLNSQRFIDPTLRAPGETVSYRPLMRTSVGLLSYDNGVDSTITLTDRPYLPLRPANVKVNGQGFGTVDVTGDAVVTWSNRNRLTETGQVLGWTAGTVTPEAGQTTTVEVLDGNGAVLHTYAGLTGTTYTVVAADLAGASAIRVASVRDGDRSLQAFELTVN